jgi:phenylalanine-4-hydroxylase
VNQVVGVFEELVGRFLVAEYQDPKIRLQKLESVIKAMARFFWFSIEFGLMKNKHNTLCAYGSGLLSSFGELQHCIESPDVQRYPFQLEWVINQYFEIDSYQPLLFVVDSFDHLFSQVDELETWVRQGKLFNVSGGEPGVDEKDLSSFLEAGLATS